MHHLVYISKAVMPMGDKDLTSLLKQSRSKNSNLDITGVLLYGNQYFIQLLEGEKTAVTNLYNEISKDLRHSIITKLADGPVEQHLFPDWKMGFRKLSEKEITYIGGYIDPTPQDLFETETKYDEASVLTVLNAFVLNNIHEFTDI